MIKTAVILAAGMGSRLRENSHEKPKGFLEIGGRSLIHRSLECLYHSGVERVIIGTGYRHEHYDQLASSDPRIRCVINPIFSNSGSMYTLFNLRTEITEDFLLLESDLLYDAAGIPFLVSHPENNVILCSGPTRSGDEVYIEADETKCLTNLSKDPSALRNIFGELVGITKLSHSSFSLLCSFVGEQLKAEPQLEYEQGLVRLSRKTAIHLGLWENYTWCEIDNREHLDRAAQLILPKLSQLEHA